jgi:hypothetical protein
MKLLALIRGSARITLRQLLTIAATVALILLIPILAYAQVLPPPVANNPNSAALVGWCAFGYMVLGPLVSTFRPDNPFLPFSVSTQMRMMIVTGGGLAEAVLLAIYGGQPWSQAVIAGFCSAFAAYAGHGTRTLPGATASEAVQQKSGKPPAPPPAADVPLPPPPAVPK